MGQRINLDARLVSEIREAVDVGGWVQRDLASTIGVSQSGLSRFLSGARPSFPVQALRELLSILDLDPGRYLAQFELELDDSMIDQVTRQVRGQLERLRKETPRLYGDAFHAFVGLRVTGARGRVFEGSFRLPGRQLEPTATSGDTLGTQSTR